MTGVGWYSQQISLNFLNLVKFYFCKPKSTGRGSLIKKQTICIYVFAKMLRHCSGNLDADVLQEQFSSTIEIHIF
jgi:hypothetical protein